MALFQVNRIYYTLLAPARSLSGQETFFYLAWPYPQNGTSVREFASYIGSVTWTNWKQGVTPDLPSPRMRGRTAVRFLASSSQDWLNDQNCVSSSSIRIQTGKYEICGVPSPVEDRTCLVCKQNQSGHEQHFLMFCNGHDVLRQELIN